MSQRGVSFGGHFSATVDPSNTDRTRGCQQPVNVLFLNHLLSQRIVGTVIAKASVETRSIEAASDSTAL
jgi:hypothetical protein